jgi:hypothetical protein
MSDSADDLFARLKGVGRRVDAVPGHVVAAARASGSWHNIDAELAELVYDSLLDAELVGVRGGAATRQLTFETPGLSLEVEVAGEPSRLNGQISPAQETDIEVRHADGSFTVRTDVLGHFRIEPLPPGPVSFAYQATGSKPTTHTDWVVL